MKTILCYIYLIANVFIVYLFLECVWLYDPIAVLCYGSMFLFSISLAISPYFAVVNCTAISFKLILL